MSLNPRRADPLRTDPLRIEHLPLAALTSWARNARTHSKKQLRQLADSIATFGWTNPVLMDGGGTILAGHGRVEAAKLLGPTAVPCVRLEHMTPAQKRAHVLADNKLALNAGWDEELLGEELAVLMGIEGLGFDLSVTGVSIAEVDGLVEGLAVEEPGCPEDGAVPETAPRRVRLGDVWQLGAHRLVCGDALGPEMVARPMAGPDGQDREQARMVFSDPPYNVPIEGHVLTRRKGKNRRDWDEGRAGNRERGAPPGSEVGRDGDSRRTGATATRAVPHPEFAMAAGEMTPEEFTAFLTTAFRNMADHSVEGSIHFLCMDWRHMGEMLEAGGAVYAELKNLIVWAKDNGGMGSFYRSRHELVFAFRKGRAPHVNSFELGQHGRHRTNVWEYKGANTRRAGRLEELALHPTAKPVQMIADAIKDVSARGEIVLDLFGGSGSTLIAAQKTGRRARLVELDPVYCDRILARWEAQARDEADLLLDRVPAGRRGRRSCQWECGSPGGGGGMSRRDHDDLDEDHTRGQPGRSARSPGQGGLPALRGARLARPTAHEVGYGEPPAEHRFPKGRSGNPKGRPRGAKGKTSGVPSLKEERLKQIVLEEAYRTITVRGGERAVTVPMAQAVIRSLAVNAAKGQHRAQRLFAELLAGTETANRRLHDEWLNAAMSYKVE